MRSKTSSLLPVLLVLAIGYVVPSTAFRGKFLQLTDIHFDPAYMNGGSVHTGCHAPPSSIPPSLPPINDVVGLEKLNGNRLYRHRVCQLTALALTHLLPCSSAIL
jgi:hypothetical protein